jgi:hypothetical protein
MAEAGHLTGTAEELVPQLEAFRAMGVERVYLWLTDFASIGTLTTFGREVIAAFR